jgi:hypothetical protein
MAMYSTVLLAEENRQLQTENARQKKKKAKQRGYIAIGGVLTGQEDVQWLQVGDIDLIGRVTDQPRES